jgi:hypothetical protein
MSFNNHVTAAMRGAAFALAILVPAGSTAFAQQATLDHVYHPGINDAFGAQSEQQILRAARAAPATAPLTAEQRQVLDKEFKVGENGAFGAASAPQPAQLADEYARTASTVPIVGGKRDLVGAGGAQDDLARVIYQPGTRGAGW